MRFVSYLPCGVSTAVIRIVELIREFLKNYCENFSPLHYGWPEGKNIASFCCFDQISAVLTRFNKNILIVVCLFHQS